FEIDEAAKDGKKAEVKEFGLDDAYNLILLAMQDRSMMPPNKMKLHGTAKERAMLHHAATRINALIADPDQRIKLSAKNPPKLVLGMINPLGLKDALQNDPFDQMVMDIRNNDTDPNGWVIREEQEA